LTGAICALGGQWRTGLTRDVTHLFALGTTSEKYQTAIHYQKDTRVKVIVPHWFDDVVRLGIANIPTLQYEWPDPQVIRPGNSLSQDVKHTRKPSETQSSLFKSAILGNTSDSKIPDNIGAGADQHNVWNEKKILLSRTLDLSPGRLEALKAGIERFGGFVVDDPRSLHDEANKVGEADVLITRYRSGAAYIKVCNALHSSLTSGLTYCQALKSKQKLVGSLAWLFYVHTSLVITPPTDQLLHYPIYENKILGFERHVSGLFNTTLLQ
jgi:twin BRCT domain